MSNRDKNNILISFRILLKNACYWLPPLHKATISPIVKNYAPAQFDKLRTVY